MSICFIRSGGLQRIRSGVHDVVMGVGTGLVVWGTVGTADLIKFIFSSRFGVGYANGIAGLFAAWKECCW